MLFVAIVLCLSAVAFVVGILTIMVSVALELIPSTVYRVKSNGWPIEAAGTGLLIVLVGAGVFMMTLFFHATSAHATSVPSSVVRFIADHMSGICR